MNFKLAEISADVFAQLEEGIYLVDRDRRICYWSPGAEALTGYRSEEVVGSRCMDRILMHVNGEGQCLCKEACPLAKTIQDGQPRNGEVFLHHRAGHRLPVRVRVAPLRDPQGNIIGAIETFADASTAMLDLERIRELEQLAFLDSLTQLATRRYFDSALESRFAERARYQWEFGLILIDIDHFKLVNDQHGHPIGDQALKMVARTISANCRPFDLACRWGGDEFALLVLNVNAEQLHNLAQRICHLVSQCFLEEKDQLVTVTVSLGATLALPDESPRELLARADKLLYQAKREGRNRLACAA